MIYPTGSTGSFAGVFLPTIFKVDLVISLVEANLFFVVSYYQRLEIPG